MTNQEISQGVLEMAKDILELDIENFDTDEMDLDALDVDSLDKIELLMAIQQEFNVKFTPEQLKSIKSLDDVVAIIAASL